METFTTILGRKVVPGDIVMNDWTDQRMKVIKVILLRDINEVRLDCIRLSDEKPEQLIGNYNDGIITKIDLPPAFPEDR